MPPFLLKVEGDLSYMGRFDPSASRDLTVHVIENEGNSRTPSFQGLPAFLRIDPTDVSQAAYTLPGTIDRSYRFKVSFTSPPPQNPFQGEFFIIDPWKPERKERVGVLATFSPPVQVVPPLVALKPKQDLGARSRFSIISRTLLEGLQASVEGGADCPILVTPTRVDGPAMTATFEVNILPGSYPPEGSEIHIVVTWAGDGHLSIPVVISR